MKVAFIIPNLYPPGGNAVTVVKYIQEASKKCDQVLLFQSYKFSSDNNYHLNLLIQIPNVKVVTLRLAWYKIIELTRNMPFGFIIHYIYFPIFVKLRKLLNKKILLKNLEGINGIYAFDFVDSDIFPKGTPPVIVGTHNQKMGTLKVKAINAGILVRNASGIRLFESERIFVKDLEDKKVEVIPKGIDTNLFFPRETVENTKLKFLYVARLEPKKGLDILLESWKISNVRDKAELHIVGDGRLSYMVRNLSDESIIYHGPLYDKELADIYRASDVFIFPTLWDAQPTVIVEAVSSGLFTLCSDYMTGVYDDFQEMGFLKYVRSDAKNFAKAIVDTLDHWKEDFEVREQMHSFVEKNRSQKNEIDMILSFIEKISNERNQVISKELTKFSETT